jgi:predicted lipoprotein with Yx(FWY)xxD motif
MRRISVGIALVLAALCTAVVASAAGGAPVKVETTPDLGKVVANAQGRTLYLFRADHGTTSACYGKCATFWPPLITSGKPVAMVGIKQSLLGTTKRKDGKLQVTYKGHPLYTFLEDKQAGMTKGEGLNAAGAKWYALAPSGSTIDKD